jgi:hypothetical protein
VRPTLCRVPEENNVRQMAYPRRQQHDLHGVVTKKNIMLHTQRFDPEENFKYRTLKPEEYNVTYMTL